MCLPAELVFRLACGGVLVLLLLTLWLLAEWRRTHQERQEPVESVSRHVHHWLQGPAVEGVAVERCEWCPRERRVRV